MNGADMVRIARGLAVEPWLFTQTAPAAPDDPTGVVLDGGRRRVTLALATAAHGCVFFVRAASGAGCCGIGDLAPVACRVFPADPPASTAQAGDPVAVVRDDLTDEPGEWTGDEPTELLRTWAADRDHWHETIARWNAQTPPGIVNIRGVEDFQRYLLEAQGAREAGAPWPEEVRV